jgi:hypothetical protein
MKTYRKWNLFAILAGIAVMVLMLWSGSIRAGGIALGQDVTGGPQPLLTSDADMPDASVGKRSPLPEVSPNDRQFWKSSIRDPFKLPKSKQLCSAGLVEACTVPEKSSVPGS